MTIRRSGEWTLHKAESGKYIVRESGTQRATILTAEFDQGLGIQAGLNTYEVKDFSEVEAKFEDLATESRGLL